MRRENGKRQAEEDKLGWLVLAGVLLTSFFIILRPVASAQGSASVVYHAKAVHTVSGETFRPGSLLVKDGLILDVGPAKPAHDVQVVNWRDLEIFPALISPTSSLGLAEISALRPTRDFSEVGEFTPDVEAWTAVNPDSELIPVARANGIGHALVAPMGGAVSGVSGLVKLDGWGVEAMTIKRHVALHLWWPGLSLDTSSKKKPLEEQTENRKKLLAKIEEFFDDAEAYAQAKEAGGGDFDVVPAWEAMLPFLSGKKQKPVMVHADELRQIKAAVAWAKRRKLRIILAGAKDAWQAADLLAEEKVPVIFQHVFTSPARDFDPHDVHFRAPGLLVNAGVKLAIGMRLGSWTAADQRNLPYHAAHVVPYGLSRKDALAAITLRPAEMLGVADQLGSLEKGKEATFLAATGDLLDPRTQVRHLILAGKKSSLESRHVKLHRLYSQRPGPGLQHMQAGAVPLSTPKAAVLEAHADAKVPLPPRRLQHGHRPAVLEAHAEGNLTLNGKAVKRAVLPDALRDLAPKRLLIRAHRDLPYAKVLDLMSIAKQTGVNDFKLATD